MAITATAGAVLTQSDSIVTQTVNVFRNGNPFKTIPIQYTPGTDAASALSHMNGAVQAFVSGLASDGTTQAVASGTVLTLVAATIPPPPTPPVGFDAWNAAWSSYLSLKRLLDADVPSVTAQRVATAKAAHEALYDPSFEAFV